MEAVTLLSGGMDSTTLLYLLKKQLPEPGQVSAISFYYGQRHMRELRSAQTICDGVGEHALVVNLSDLLPVLQGSALTDPGVDVPEGHYAAENMKVTVVPNRNMIMLSVATAWAVSKGARRVAYACHKGDHTIYPDCRPEFVNAMTRAMKLCHFEPVELLTPFVDKTKADIVKLGVELGVPFQLTWSCYKGGERHCGKCGTCTERKEAFRLAGVPDPTEYES